MYSHCNDPNDNPFSENGDPGAMLYAAPQDEYHSNAQDLQLGEFDLPGQGFDYNGILNQTPYYFGDLNPQWRAYDNATEIFSDVLEPTSPAGPSALPLAPPAPAPAPAPVPVSSLRGSSGTRPHLCSQCAATFVHKKHLDRHVGSVHPGPGAKFFVCCCGKSDILKDSHRKHIEKCKRAFKSPYGCNCGKTSDGQDAHVEHLKDCQSKPGRRRRGDGPSAA